MHGVSPDTNKEQMIQIRVRGPDRWSAYLFEIENYEDDIGKNVAYLFDI
jgi:hypothetical protein